jgi:hypothetical protein
VAAVARTRLAAEAGWADGPVRAVRVRAVPEPEVRVVPALLEVAALARVKLARAVSAVAAPERAAVVSAVPGLPEL